MIAGCVSRMAIGMFLSVAIAVLPTGTVAIEPPYDIMV